MEAQNSKPQRFLLTLKKKLIRWHPELLFWGILAVIIVRAVCTIVSTVRVARIASAPLEFLLPYNLRSHIFACIVLVLIYVLGKRNGKPHRTIFWGGLAAVTLNLCYKIVEYFHGYSFNAMKFSLFRIALAPHLLLGAFVYIGLFLLRMFWKRRKCYF